MSDEITMDDLKHAMRDAFGPDRKPMTPRHRMTPVQRELMDAIDADHARVMQGIQQDICNALGIPPQYIAPLPERKQRFYTPGNPMRRRRR